MRATPMILAAAGIAMVTSFSSPAAAADNEAVINLTAIVRPFCRISHENEGEGAPLVDGIAILGRVRELCNTANGYRVHAQFMNLHSGTLMTGADALPISTDGEVAFQSPIARSVVREWRIVDAVEQPFTNIYMRVSISPI